MAEESVVVEVPLDLEYLTRDGLYEAGYRYGAHIRPSKDLPKWVLNDERYSEFVQGVDDGYGDGTEKNRRNIAHKRDPNKEFLEELRKEMRQALNNDYLDDNYDILS